MTHSNTSNNAGTASSTVLDEARTIIYGDREQTYGDPSKNLTAIAQLWTTWLKSRGLMPAGPGLTFEDVACMMVLLKVARLGNQIDHRDSQVDAVGYMALLERCQSNMAAKGKIGPQ
jgi:hypothetical protein